MLPDFLWKSPKNLFFTGKGGVGKTTSSTAVAIALADDGRRVLLVSTDPASNLDEILGVRLSAEPVAIPGVSGLYALNVDPEKAAATYREKLVGPYRGVLPEAAVRSIEEQFSGACTVEIAAFNEFATLMGNPAAVAGFDHIIFDTAPTGHTLRLLSLPAAWSMFIDTGRGGGSCLGPLAGLKERHQMYDNTRRALADRNQTLVVVVSRPDDAPLHEAERAAAELRCLEITNQCLVINGLLQDVVSGDPLAILLQERQQKALHSLPSALALLPRLDVPLRAAELVGIPALRSFFSAGPEQPLPLPENRSGNLLPPSLCELIDTLAALSGGVIMAMGKGGVGKTTLAAVIATELARQGKQVHLTTTDPAADLARYSRSLPRGLRISRINPKVEAAVYVSEVLKAAWSNLDKEGRALLEEDLRSPCTEEIAVFRAFAKTVAAGSGGFVVIDTAPTGHTLLLLDAAESYHREVSRSMHEMPEAVRQLLPRLRDPDFTRVLLVTQPEATPVHEALDLQTDLRRAGIEPMAWIINQSMVPLAVTDPVLAHRRLREFAYIDMIVNQGKPVYLAPWQSCPEILCKERNRRG